MGHRSRSLSGSFLGGSEEVVAEQNPVRSRATWLVPDLQHGGVHLWYLVIPPEFPQPAYPPGDR